MRVLRLTKTRIPVLLVVPLCGAGLLAANAVAAPPVAHSGVADGARLAQAATPTRAPGADQQRRRYVAGASAASVKQVSGRIVLKGPAKAPRGAAVVFSLRRGATKLVRVDRAAPFAVPIDTRTLRDGRYSLAVTTVVRGRAVTTTRSTLQIDNGSRRQPTTTSTGTKNPATSTTTSTSTSTSTASSKTTSKDQQGSFAAQVVKLTNDRRAASNCPALTVSATLTRVAQAHSEDMARRNFFSHSSPEGKSPFDRMTAAGYRYTRAAENIAAGQMTPQAVVSAWMNSEGHRRNILNCGLREIGVGYATGGSYRHYWTQDFGTPRSPTDGRLAVTTQP